MADEPEEPAKGEEPPEPLGDGGKKALDAERRARREAEKKLSDLNDQLQALQDKDKTDSQRLTEKLTQLEKDLVSASARADRYEVALEKGLDMVRAKRLTGTTREELEADADELKGWTAAETQTPPPGKPAEDLKGGGDPTQEPEPDIRKVVESIPRGF